MTGGFFCALGRAHALGGVSPLRTLMKGTASRTARAAATGMGLKEAEGKAPARRTWPRMGAEGKEFQSPIGGSGCEGIWGEGECAIPGEVRTVAVRLSPARDGETSVQKAAEGRIVVAHSDKGPNREGRRGAEVSMDDGDAQRMAERPTDSLSVAGGTSKSTERERKVSITAYNDRGQWWIAGAAHMNVCGNCQIVARTGAHDPVCKESTLNEPYLNHGIPNGHVRRCERLGP
jgi:hypothetical protein